ncbi:hypothetical protein CP02DC14_2255, partial [Chlamydia psittaci 02DC14]
KHIKKNMQCHTLILIIWNELKQHYKLLKIYIAPLL